MKEFAVMEWQRATSALEAARKLADIDSDSAASRAYYAAFHAVTALFALRGQSFSKHSALRAALHRDLIRSGEWSTELGEDFELLSSLRHRGDYGGMLRVSKNSAQLSLRSATSIVDAVGCTCPELGQGSPDAAKQEQ